MLAILKITTDLTNYIDELKSLKTPLKFRVMRGNIIVMHTVDYRCVYSKETLDNLIRSGHIIVVNNKKFKNKGV